MLNTSGKVSPSNFAATNPEVIAKTIETGGENLLKGLANLLGDLSRGQMTHVAPGAFEVGRNIATTPGKVIHRTPLYELIQYAPTTDAVLATPLVIFPPWINRFYILDLSPEKSFIRWAVGEGLTVFMVSWKSADASMADVAWDDYVAAQRDAIDTIRAVLDVPSVHAIGYCVAGTTLAATLAVQKVCGEGDRVASATFFTAQVDFAEAGELKLLVDDALIALTDRLSPDGFLDGRFMAMTFNTLRGQDLIWNYVTNNYLLGKDYAAFDLLHWNGDTTNLPGAWHRSYLADLYRDNRLVEPGALLTESPRLPGLDGAKMSKSYGNALSMREEPAALTKKVRAMTTDPARVRRTDPGNPAKCPVWALHKVYSDASTREWVVQGCTTAGIGCLDCKQPLIDAMLAEQAPIRERAQRYLDQPALLRDIVDAGCDRARAVARATMDEVRQAMGLAYR